MGQIPSNINLADIIGQTITNIQQLNSGYIRLLNVINGSLDKIANIKLNVQDLGKLKQAGDFVAAYSAALGVIIHSVLNSNKDLIKDKSIVELLGYVTETTKDIDGSTSTKGKFILLDGLVVFSGVLSNMSRMLESISKADYGKNLTKAKINITLFIENTKDLISFMVEQLQELNQVDARNLLGDESVVEKLYKTEETIDKNKTSLQESEKTTVKTFGVLDVLDKYLTIVKLVNDIKIPNPAKVFIQVKLFNISLRIILSSIKKIADVYGTKDFMFSLSNLSNSFTNITRIVDGLDELVEGLTEVSKIMIVKAPIINRALRKLYRGNKFMNGVGEGGILVLLSDMLYSREFLLLAEYDRKNVDQVNKLVSSLLEVVSELSRIGSIKTLVGLFIANFVMKVTTITFGVFLDLINTIPEIPEETKEKIITLSENIASVKLIIESLVDIAKDLLIMTIIALPATLGLIFTTLFVKQLIVFIRWISFLVHVISDKEYTGVTEKLEQIRSIIFSLLLVSAAVILLAVTAVVAIPASIAAIGVIIAIGLVIIAVRALLWVYDAIDQGKSGSTKVLMTMSAICAIIGAIVIVTLELIALSHVYKLIDWKGLFIGLGIFVIALAAVIGVGALMTLSAGILIGFIAVAGVVTSIMLFTITAMIVISLELLLFCKIDLSPLMEEKDGQNLVELQMKTIVNAVVTVSNEIWRAYKEGNGLIKTVIVSLWLTVNIFAIGALIIVTGLLLLFNNIASRLDEKAVALSVQKILNLANYIIDVALGGKGLYTEEGEKRPDPEKEGFIDKLISIGGGVLELAKSLLVFVNLATVALSVAVMWGLAAMLNKITEFDLKEDQIIPKVNQIILCANTVSQAVFSAGNAKTTEEAANETAFDKLGQFIGGGIKAIGGAIGNIASAGILGTAMIAVGEVEGLAAMLNKINEFKVEEKTIVDHVNQIIKLSSIVSETVSAETNKVSIIDPKKVKQFGVYVDDSVKLMKQINKLDSDKLVKYSDMWSKMSEFMDKMKDLNIEELADAIVNRIAPAMEGISDNVDKIGTNTTKPNIATNPAAMVPVTPQPTDATTKLPPERPKDYTEQVERIARLLEEILETRQ